MGESQSLRDLPSGTVANIAIILMVSVLAIIQLKAVIQPLVIAILLFLLIRPAAQWLEERPIIQKYGHPLMPYGVLVVILFVVMWMASQLLYSNLTAFTDEIPGLTDQLNSKLSWLEGLELWGYSFDVSGLTALLSLDTINEYLTGFVGSLASFTASAVTVLIFLLFIILEAETLPRRLKAAYPEDAERVQAVASSSGEGINTYVVTRATVAFGQAVVAGIVLWYLDIPGWFMWASITFMMDFIPYVGALISLIPPIFLGLIVLDPTGAMILILILVANQQAWGAVVEPQLAGQRLDMSPIVLLLLVAFWGWAWGHGDGAGSAARGDHEDRPRVRPANEAGRHDALARPQAAWHRRGGVISPSGRSPLGLHRPVSAPALQCLRCAALPWTGPSARRRAPNGPRVGARSGRGSGRTTRTPLRLPPRTPARRHRGAPDG